MLERVRIRICEVLEPRFKSLILGYNDTLGIKVMTLVRVKVFMVLEMTLGFGYVELGLHLIFLEPPFAYTGVLF